MSSSRTQNLIRSTKFNINNCNSLKRLTAIAYTLCQAQLIMITKEFNITGHDANTLPQECIGKNESGWEISGEIHEDYYYWVNDFEAIHLTYGKVWGNFEDKVFADTEEGYNHFIENHPPESWDYWDI